METAGLEAQVFVLAVSWNGELTVAPLEGVATVISETGVASTVMFNSTSACAFWPQHFTWSTCEPGAADTFAEKDVGSITAVPLSIEYPIETAGTPEQVVVLAETVNGEVS